MEVFYRIYAGASDDRPFANGDKWTLVRACLYSFIQSCYHSKADIRLNILLDGCPNNWIGVIRGVAMNIKYNAVMWILDGIGNKPSFLRQLEMALCGPSDEFVFFAEDDYLYRPEAVARMLAFSKVNDSYITPYDHPDRYSRGDDRWGRDYIEVCGGWHWRTAESTTMTFGGPRWAIQNAADIMRKHACEGRGMWYPIWDRGQSLWSPIPGLATHVHTDFLAPCVNWSQIWDNTKS